MTIANGTRSTKGGHRYFFDGIWYPSVTTILQKVDPVDLSIWRRNYSHPRFRSADEYTRFSSIRGIFVHFSILNSLSPFTIDDSDLPAFSDWLNWQDMMKSEVCHARGLWDEIDIEFGNARHIETPLCHHGKRYAGQPDIWGDVTYDGETCKTLIDIKTSKRPYDHHFIQVGAYGQLVGQKQKIERALLIYLGPEMDEALVKEFDVDDLEEKKEEFNSMLGRYYEMEKTQ